jgi:hypothetical protein
LNAEEIMQVLRLTAMSRVNHPDQQRFCDKLAELFSGWIGPPAKDPMAGKSFADVADALPSSTELAAAVEAAVKRGPGRPKKA